MENANGNKEMVKVSVIVPIYNVGPFIGHCAESLMQQTLQEAEFIFVNDATPDNSMEVLESVLERYPERKEQIRILTHAQNKGLPAARNTGLAMASGAYVFHCDSDDFVEPNMLQVLYDAAVSQNAEIVWCDWFLTFKERERYMKQPSFETPIEALKGMLGGCMKFNVWNKLVKRDLYTTHRICFPEGYGMGEDMTMLLLFACAGKVGYVPRAFYHYVKWNANAFSQSYSERHLVELQHNVERVELFLKQKLGAAVDREIAFLKLEAKFPFLLMKRYAFYQLWQKWYPEANAYIMQNPYVSFRSRLLQWCAWKKQYWLVRLHYWLVYKFIYGIIYH